jgi:hypothetical protein
MAIDSRNKILLTFSSTTRNYVFAICGFVKVFSPQKITGSIDRKSQKINGPQIANPQNAAFAEGPQISQKILVRKFADLRFAELIGEPPTFV